VPARPPCRNPWQELLLRATAGGHFQYGGGAAPHSGLRFLQQEEADERLASLRNGSVNLCVPS
jgi:hypothetical protein